jgi:hypothetical protein
MLLTTTCAPRPAAERGDARERGRRRELADLVGDDEELVSTTTRASA